MTLKRFFILLLVLVGLSADAQKYQWKQASSGGYAYKYVSDDPMEARFYTLKNGLTVVLTVNKKEPRISIRIPVRTGSNNDPSDHTGLAHYLEHLLFKGTDKYGSQDWQKEKPLLDQIEDLYEKYNKTTDVTQRKAIYRVIDSVSGLASRYAIANEYGTMMAAIGSQRTNAHTWVEETVYEEDIPSNAVDKLLAVEAERFRNPIFRLFHTELEAVYEEKNRTLDNDIRKVDYALHEMLFPTHNYGKQTTIGTIEHLKNPSLTAIRDYYHKYYVPNNMAIVMSGDFDYDQMIKKIDTQFGYMQPKDVMEYKGPKEPAITAPVLREIYGPTAENLRLAFRVGPSHSREELLAEVTARILANGKAGLIDLNLNKQQKVLSAFATTQQYKDYGYFQLSATPKQGQTLEEARDLLFSQIDILKKGEFDESLIQSMVANAKLSQLNSLEDNTYRSESIVDQFIKNRNTEWDKEVSGLEQMSHITKKEIVEFANKFFGNNYVIIFKRKGEDKTIVKVDKPQITPVQTNTEKKSEFVNAFNMRPLDAMTPVWLDFTKDIQKAKVGNADILYVPNKNNSLFRLNYRFNIGQYNSKYLGVALQYLQYLGTDTYSPEDISRQFYKLAANFSTQAAGEETYLSVSGLQENFTKAVALFEDLIHNCKGDEQVLTSLKERLLKNRNNNKLNKGVVQTALRNYAVYGPSNPFNYTYSDEELKNISSADLINLLHTLMNYEHAVLYYGPETLASATASITKMHALPGTWSPAPAAVKFVKLKPGNNNQVLFTNYDAVQADIWWIRNLDAYTPEQEALAALETNYFHATVFQTIREAKGLAYSTTGLIQVPAKRDDSYTFMSYVGTQADKLKESIATMNDVINNFPKIDQQFLSTQKSVMKDIETERITKDGIIFSYLNAKKKGLSSDIRTDIYNRAKNATLTDLVNYHNQQLNGKNVTYTIVGSDKKINVDDLKQYGEVKRIELKELFGY
jgi:predicted Zn-dependent peptidase